MLFFQKCLLALLLINALSTTTTNMPLKDDIANYYTQGKEVVGEYIETIKEKDKQRKEAKANQDKQSTEGPATAADNVATSSAMSTSTSVHSLPADDKAGPSRPVTPSMYQKYKDRLSFKLPSGQFDIGKGVFGCVATQMT